MIIKNEGPESVLLGLVCAKQPCDFCGTLGKDGKLKHCKGCASMLYCSTECQTAAWPSHKHLCTSRSALEVPSLFANLGYATLAELSIAAYAWAKAHTLALLMVVNMRIEVHGDGADAALNEGLIVGFQLGPPESKPDGTPATAFGLKSVAFMEGDFKPYYSSPHAVAQRANVLKLFQAACPHPDLIGVIPIVLYFQDMNMGTLHVLVHMPLYRRHGAEALHELTTTALENLTLLCMELIDEGIVLRLPPGGGPKIPEFGIIARQGKSLTWTGYPSPTGIPWFMFGKPQRVADFAAYQRLGPYTSLLTNVSR